MALKHWLTSVVVLALAMTAPAGCGGSGSSTNSTSAGAGTPELTQGKASKPAPSSTGSQGKQSGGEPEGKQSDGEPEGKQSDGEPEGKQSDGGAQATSAGSRFVKRANAYCSNAKEKLIVVTARFNKAHGSNTSSPFGSREYTRQVAIPEMEKQIGVLRGMTPPSALQPRVESFLAAWRNALKITEAESKALVNKKGEAEALAPVAELARQLGLGECAYA